jgi:hypothetical protein
MLALGLSMLSLGGSLSTVSAPAFALPLLGVALTVGLISLGIWRINNRATFTHQNQQNIADEIKTSTHESIPTASKGYFNHFNLMNALRSEMRAAPTLTEKQDNILLPKPR